MKRITAMVIAFVLFLIPDAFAKESVTTVHDFEIRFGAASLFTESGHFLNSTNENRSDGEVNDTIQVIYYDSELLQLSMPHGTDDVIGVLGMYLPDGNGDHAADFILLISEMLYASGVTESTTETGDVLDRLGMFDNLDDGAQNKIVIDGIDIGYMVSSSLGIWFYIEV